MYSCLDGLGSTHSGVDPDGWMHAVRVGDVALVDTPADYCGEISVDLKSWAEDRFVDLWVLALQRYKHLQ